MSLTAIDLFCGAGGLSLGLARAGFKVIGAVDSWEPAVKTYRANFSHPVVATDMRQLSGADLTHELGLEGSYPDLVAGGPPCQGFSVQRIGEDFDERNNLLFEFGRLVIELRAKLFLMENVPGLRGRRGEHLLARFRDLMLTGGYRTRTFLLNAADFGVPQVRRRLFCVGLSTADSNAFRNPVPTHSEQTYRTVADAIGDLPVPPNDFSPAPGDLLHRRMRLSEQNLQRLRRIPEGGGFEDLPVDLRVNCHKQGAARIGHRNVYGRLAAARPAVTITARFDSFTRGKFGHPSEDRSITLREGARLQTFPDDFKFFGTQEQIAALIGNAVPPLLAETLGRALAGSLLRGKKDSEAVQNLPGAEEALPLFGGSMRH